MTLRVKVWSCITIYAVIFCVALCVLIYNTAHAGDDWAEDLWIHEFNETTFYPQIAYSYIEDAPWTFWNKFFAGSAVVGQAFGVISTENALNRGCVEGNTNTWGDDPDMLVLAGVKVVVLGLTYYLTEKVVSYTSVKQKQLTRNLVYGAFGAIGAYDGFRNSSLDCK